ncbi:alcohol dehydrogenase YqhD (iron-dependent ADH family) [Sporomusaceae bacterium BoRhaA]|uniref:iron-containing alcohol dehydrogenase n=1 Tax=Pelorhabdus rhamnosifermentans TaxID=2772457 RepID=UPI001C05FA7F|nr:iron-containing alcohol dehydrogenase [Pelorhabdus rhamnosifermentans]MBU2699949.1 alcohol dehydrogenase YqhD (iron-dependent ADH family) [Pelorhabdus rhamnosifermentans]
MKSFEFYSPTKVIFGKGIENQVGKEIKAWGGTKVMLHFGGKSAKKSGLLDRIERSLQEAGIEYISLGGVVPNPRLSLVREGIELCRKEKVDFLLAVGGGSVIDSAKAIAMALANSAIDVWDIYAGKAQPVACLPVGVVLTIAASGSETSNSSVITNEEGWLKKGFNDNLTRPKFALMNPELTYSLPTYQTAAGIVDIMMHTIERYFCSKKGNELTDRIAEQVLRNTVRYGKICMEDPGNYKARSEIMWSGSISHNHLTGLGGDPDFSGHAIEHELGGMFDVTHGAGLAAVWCWWARYVVKNDINRFAQYAINVWDCVLDPIDPEITAMEGIKKTEEFFTSLDMPINLSQLGVGKLTDAQIEEMANKCCNFGKRVVGTLKPLKAEDIKKIYHMANN